VLSPSSPSPEGIRLLDLIARLHDNALVAWDKAGFEAPRDVVVSSMLHQKWFIGGDSTPRYDAIGVVVTSILSTSVIRRYMLIRSDCALGCRWIDAR
jgi:hypothetical protein